MTKREYNTAVQTLSPLLYRYALKFLRDAATADDVVQDAFLKLWLNRKEIAAKKGKAWLFRTAHNAMLNMLKKAKRSEPIAENSAAYPHHSYEDPHRFELKDVIDRSLATLPSLQRSIILLRDLEGYAYKEIGEMLELSEAQVKVYLFRARKKMKDALKGIYELK